MATKKLPPLQWLHTYLAVINNGSFSAAAHELHMTQAAVSKQIRQLEHQFGESLFERHARGVTPTAAGEAIRERVDSAFSILQDIDQQAHSDSKVHLRCDIAYADAVLSWQLEALQSNSPNIALQISTFIWLDVSRHSLYDIQILLDNGDIPGMKRTPLGPEYSIIVASPTVKKTWNENPSTVTLLTRIGQEQAWQDWLQHYPANRVLPETQGLRKLVCDSSLICKKAALAGQGIALMRYSQVCNELEEGTLVRLEDFITQNEIGFCLYEPDNARENPLLVDVTEWIKASHRRVQEMADKTLARGC